MQISLSRNSWHAQYYNWVKGYYPTYEFKSLCPYFWTIVTYLLLFPVFLTWKGLKLVMNHAVIPTKNVVTSSFKKSDSDSEVKKEPSKLVKWYEKNDKKIVNFFAYTYFGSMLLFLLLVLVSVLIKSFTDNGFWMTMVYIFSVIGGLTTLVLCIWGIITIFETETWKMIKGMSYSVKNKVCPMIEWKNDETIKLQ